jgi:hypothetical protein
MNNGLFVKSKELSVQIKNCGYDVHMIQIFIDNYGPLFQEETSKEALIKIKEYLRLQKTKIGKLRRKENNVRKKIEASCNHEILRENNDQAICMLCGKWFWTKEVSFKHIFIVGDGGFYNIYNIICTIAENDEDILDVFENYCASNVDKLDGFRVYNRKDLGGAYEKKRNS